MAQSGSSFALLLVALISFGCAGQDSDSSGASVQRCRADSECGTGQVCKKASTSGSRALHVAPCPYTTCATSASCGPGSVCVPATQVPGFTAPSFCVGFGASICATSCQTAGCPSGYQCQSDGTCRVLKCNEPGALECPGAFDCDPARAAAEPVVVAGSITADDRAANARGCARKLCNVTGGFVCRELWACDPTTSTDGSGCVPIPCTTAGRCSDDTYYICKPTSSHSRYEGTDAQGCVQRNCEEGLACQSFVNGVDVGYCNFAGPLATQSGCAQKPCLESGGACLPGYKCQAISSETDARGCVTPKCYISRALCASGTTCNPVSPLADDNGCVMEPNGQGGAGGTGASSGGAGASGASSGGSRAASGGASGGSIGSGGSAAGGSAGTSPLGAASAPTAGAPAAGASGGSSDASEPTMGVCGAP